MFKHLSQFKKKLGGVSMSNSELLDILKIRFEANMNHHKNIEWAKVYAK